MAKANFSSCEIYLYVRCSRCFFSIFSHQKVGKFPHDLTTILAQLRDESFEEPAAPRKGSRQGGRSEEFSEWLQNFGSGSLLFCHGFIICIYILCICNLWDYLFNLPRQESHFFAAWFHLLWKNDLGRDPVVCPSGSTDKSSAHPKSFNIKYT